MKIKYTLITVALLAAFAAQAGTLRERIQERRAQAGARVTLPPGVTVLRDLAYGGAARQRLDVYLPPQAQHAPVILLVHGGGWAFGDKASAGVVENKVAHWSARGFIVVSTNYRMVPEADPVAQAGDVAKALAYAQQHAGEWGGDGRKLILMGHSAGAHLVTLLNAQPTLAGGASWLGTVALDSAAYDVEHIMQGRHFPLYDRAWGSDPALWRAGSPSAVLQRGGMPLLGVCSSQRRESCGQAERFQAKAGSLGMRMQVLPQDLSHKEINESLGLDGPYTAAVDAFVSTLLR